MSYLHSAGTSWMSFIRRPVGPRTDENSALHATLTSRLAALCTTSSWSAVDMRVILGDAEPRSASVLLHVSRRAVCSSVRSWTTTHRAAGSDADAPGATRKSMALIGRGRAC
jgi:hypothetical protein